MLHGRRVALPIRLLVRTWPSVWKEKPKGAAGPDLDVKRQWKKHRLVFDAWELRDDFLRIKNDQQLLAFLNKTGNFVAGPDCRGKGFYWECQKLISDMLTNRQEYWKKLSTKYRSDVAEWANPETRDGLIADLKFRMESDLPITEILVVGTLRGMIVSVHIDRLQQIPFGICQRQDCAKPFPIKSAHGQKWECPWMEQVERVVLVHRLREVIAQVAFTRFEAAAPDIEGELDIGVRRASLAREVSWLPAFENKGEGIFLQFKTKAILGWTRMPEVQARAVKLSAGFEEWRKEHQGTTREFPGAAYLMLHSFSHLLITALSLSCGYPASSIRERVYAIPNIGYGILLYTGTSDAEGTLGGLVQVGRRIQETVKAALDLGMLCSNDPVCAQHDPASRHERRFLHGAACHGCLLISETSCEQQNDFLDRALVVPTVQDLGGPFFSEIVTSEGPASVVSAV